MEVETTSDARDYLRHLPDNFKHEIEFYIRYSHLCREIAHVSIGRQLNPNEIVTVRMSEVVFWLPYQSLIGLGPPAIPYMLREAKRSSQSALLMTAALSAITGYVPVCWRDHVTKTRNVNLTPAESMKLGQECLEFWSHIVVSAIGDNIELSLTPH